MNAQELRNLQEAYLDVYENQQLDEVLDTPERANEYARKNVRSMLGAFAKGVANKDISQLKTINKRTEGAKRAKRKAERKAAEEMKEGYDFFDVILEHLVAEGYADTNKAALAIMANMSEEWKQDIVEAMSSYDRNRKRAAQRAADRNAARDRGQTGNVPGVGYVSPRRERETYTDESGQERHKSGARMPKKD